MFQFLIIHKLMNHNQFDRDEIFIRVDSQQIVGFPRLVSQNSNNILANVHCSP